MEYKWTTPAQQVLTVALSHGGELDIRLTSRIGETVKVPEMVKAHIQHWWKAERLLGDVTALAAEQQGELRSSAIRFAPGAPSGISNGFNNLRRHQQNVNSMSAIRDIAISRALSAADKAMLGTLDDDRAASNYSVLMAPMHLLKQQQVIAVL